MKKLLLLSIMFVFAASAFAAENPIDKGSMIVGGTAMYASLGGDMYEVGEDGSISTITLTPSIGYFVSPGLLIGADFTYTSISGGDDDEIDYSVFGIGPTVAYFFNMDPTRVEVKGATYPYIKGFFMYGSLSAGDDEEEDISGDITVTSFGGRGGIMMMLSNAVALDIGVQYNKDSYEPDGAEESTDGTRLQIGAGITAFVW
ncbi:MAG: outer membrane beta-barrel protein [candidate division Zixibacteria bacterium]|nr:outer membrane beta-barrel protein [candidate division Zixibacteria bacterium]